MKSKIICFKLTKLGCLISITIVLELLFIGFQIKNLLEVKNFEQISQTAEERKEANQIQESQIQKNETKTPTEQIENNKTKQEEIIESEKIQNTKKEYETMEQEIKGYKVAGKINIPKLKLDSYVLEETNNKSLKVSVTKLYGPKMNEVGNFCIAGHNYRNNKMFGGIKKLEKGDIITLTDTYGKVITYQVYENYQTDSKDVSCLNQDTGGERELTLITCTAGAIKRVIVKAVEMYD